jgi:hypothetical protein
MEGPRIRGYPHAASIDHGTRRHPPRHRPSDRSRNVTAAPLPLSQRLLALKDFLPPVHGGRVDSGVDARALLDEAAAALASAQADTQRLDKLTRDPTCFRAIGRACYWDAPNGFRRLSSPRQVIDAAIRWDAERAEGSAS